MARNYAQVMCAIWEDAEFVALSEVAQRAYFLLITQPDISAAGVLRMWTPRWAALSRTSTDETLKAALSELKAAQYIVPDWVTGELLVRSFVKWDGGYKNGKRKPLIIREARAVRSLEIKAQLRVEFGKLEPPLDASGLPEPPPPTGTDGPSGEASDRASDAGRGSNEMGGDGASASTLTGIRSSAPDTRGGVSGADALVLPFPQVDRASDVSPGTTSPSRGVVGTTEVTTWDPQPHNPKPDPPSAGDASPRPDNHTDGQRLVAHWIDQCRKRPPGTVISHTGTAITRMLDDGIAVEDIRAGIDVWAAKGLNPASLPSVVNQVMNRQDSRLSRASGDWQPFRDYDESDYEKPMWGKETP